MIDPVGLITDRSVESRGVLALAAKEGWHQSPAEVPPAESLFSWVLGFAYMGGTAPNSGFGYVSTAPNSDIVDTAIFRYVSNGLAFTNADYVTFLPKNALVPDYSLSANFGRSLVITNGSLATAMSTLITTLSSMAYYDQIPGFQTTDNVTQVFFENVLFPQSHLGYAAVVAVTTVHLVLVSLVIAAFVAYLQYTTLGQHWQPISQVISLLTETVILESSDATDKQVIERLRTEGREHLKVGIGPLKCENRIGVMAMRFRGRLNDGMQLSGKFKDREA